MSIIFNKELKKRSLRRDSRMIYEYQKAALPEEPTAAPAISSTAAAGFR
jgi:hypothetical protein